MADQKAGQRDAIVKGFVRDGGAEIACWMIRNEKFLKQVLTSFLCVADDGFPLVRLPGAWQKWITNQGELSPIRHLMTPSCDYDGKWKKKDGKQVDDLYYAAMFAEAAFYLWLTRSDVAEEDCVVQQGSLAMVRRKRGRPRRL